MNIFINSTMRSGKTLLAVLLRVYRYNLNNNHKCYSNFHIKLPNSFYSRSMILPFSDLVNSMLIIDDIWSMSNSKALIGVLVNYSGKDNIDIILTGQYYTFFEKVFRVLFDYECRTFFDKESETLYFQLIDKLGKVKEFEYNRALHPIVNGKEMYVGKIYDTKEKVFIPTERSKIDDVKKMSKSLTDIETNLSMCFSNQQKINKYYKEIGKELGYL